MSFNTKKWYFNPGEQYTNGLCFSRGSWFHCQYHTAVTLLPPILALPFPSGTRADWMAIFSETTAKGMVTPAKQSCPLEALPNSSSLFYRSACVKLFENYCKIQTGDFFNAQLFCLFIRCTAFLCCFPKIQTVKYSCLLGRRKVDGFFGATIFWGPLQKLLES